MNMLLDVLSGSIWKYVPNELHFSGCHIQLFSKSMIGPHVIQFCCPIVGWIWIEIPTHHVES